MELEGEKESMITIQSKLDKDLEEKQNKIDYLIK